MSQSKYFGKSFTTKLGPREGQEVHLLWIGDHPGGENLTPHPGEHFDEALVGLVDTLRVTRGLLKLMLQQKGIQISAANEFNREMVGTAKKLGESPDDLRLISRTILSELFEEMVAEQPRKHGGKVV